MSDLEYHPLANIFPLIEGQAFDEFCAAIRADGRLHDKIVLLDGMILDGRNRQRACDLTGVTAHYHQFNPEVEGDPLTYVLSKNLHRRHLNESQRAMVAANLATMRQGERTDVEPSAKLQKVAQGKAAERLMVSPRTVADAVKVRRDAAPEVRQAVEQGTLPASSAAKLVGLPEDVQRKVAAAADPAKAARTEISRANRDGRLDEIKDAAGGSASPALVARRKYAVIYADPPWQFDVWSRETGLEKCPDRYYPTMTVEEICALPVGDLVAETALLFLWITVPKLDRMDEIFRAWGRTICVDPDYGVVRQPWRYVSNYNWDKINIGPGRWNRNQHEHLLIARIGDVPAPLPSDRARSNYSEASTEHSAKPDHFAALIEKQFPHLPKIELFRRGPARPGWDVWGNQAEPARAATSDRGEDSEQGQARQSPQPAFAEATAGRPATQIESGNCLDPEDGLEIPTFLRRPVESVSVSPRDPNLENVGETG